MTDSELMMSSLAMNSAAQAIGVTASSEMDSRNRRWQENQAEIARQFARDEWDREFGILSEYNLPENVVERLKKGGINPALVYQNSNASTSASGQPSFSPMPTGTPAQFGYAGVLNGQSFFSGLKDLVGAAKEADTLPQTKQLLDAEIAQALSHAGLERVQSDVQQFELQLNRMFGEEMRNRELQEKVAAVLNAYADLQIKSKQGENIDADTYLKSIQALREYSQKHLNERNAAMVDKQLSYYDNMARSIINANNAAAARDVEQATDVRLTRQARIDVMRANADLLEVQGHLANNEALVSDQTLNAKYRAAIDVYKREHLINQELEQKINLLIKENNWKELEKVLGAINSATSSMLNMQHANESATRSFSNMAGFSSNVLQNIGY